MSNQAFFDFPQGLAATAAMFQIFVESMGEVRCHEVSCNATVADLKAMIEDAEFITSSLQRLSYGSVVLTEGLLAELVPESATVTLEVGVDGGMRAKWRKKRMRRLRRKRRKMRNRAK